MRRKVTKRGRYKTAGRFRSGFEKDLAQQLAIKGVKFKYEIRKYSYTSRGKRKVICPTCGPVEGHVRRQYTPDFFLSNGVVIEAKGRLTPTDRSKLATVRKSHPRLDLRILFQYDRKLTKDGKRYSDWAEGVGIPWAVKTIPEEWLLHADQMFPQTIHGVDSLFDGGGETSLEQTQ